MELGRRYPRALQALTEVRDRDLAQFAAGHGYSQLFQEVENLNRALGQPEATSKLCRTLVETDPTLAGQCYYYAQEGLLEHGEYQLCARLMGDAQARFNSAQSSIKFLPPDGFVGQVCPLVEILIATGQKTEAEGIATQAVTAFDDPRLRSAVADAEARIAKAPKAAAGTAENQSLKTNLNHPANK